MNRYDYFLNQIRTQKQSAILYGKCHDLVNTLSLVEKCFENQKSEVFKVTIPLIPFCVYGKRSLEKYNCKYNKKLKFKNIKYRYINRYLMEKAVKMCGFDIIDEVNYYNSKNIKVTYILVIK